MMSGSMTKSPSCCKLMSVLPSDSTRHNAVINGATPIVELKSTIKSSPSGIVMTLLALLVGSIGPLRSRCLSASMDKDLS